MRPSSRYRLDHFHIATFTKKELQTQIHNIDTRNALLKLLGRRSSTGWGVYRVHGAFSEEVSLGVAKISRNAFETAPEMRIHADGKELMRKVITDRYSHGHNVALSPDKPVG